MFLFKMYLVITNLVLVFYCLPLSGDPKFHTSENTSEPNVEKFTETVTVNNPGSSHPRQQLQLEQHFLQEGISLHYTDPVSNLDMFPRTDEGSHRTRQRMNPPGSALEKIYTNTKAQTSSSQNSEKQQVSSTSYPNYDFSVNETPNFLKTFSFTPNVYHRHGHCVVTKPFTTEIFIVDMCPDSTTDPRLKEHCHSRDSFPYSHPDCVIEIEHIPVQDSNGIVYRNIYCALCHGAKNPSTWYTEIETDTMTHVNTDDGKNIIILSNEPSLSPNCSQKSVPAKMSKIKFCDSSNFVEISHSHHGRSSLVEDPHTKASVFPLSFQVLMNFGINGKGHIFFSATSHTESSSVIHRCAENEFYDQNTENCKKIVCASGHKLVDSKCQPTTETLNTDTFSSLDTLDTQDQDGGTSQITLRLNVTERELLLLRQEDTDKSIVAEFSAMLNITSDRIKNFTIEFQNGTVSGKMVEVHPIVTPRPVRNFKPMTLQPFEETSVPNEKSANEKMELEYDTETYDYDPDVASGTLQETYTVIIKFILFPTKKKGSEDVTTSSVVDKLKKLIDGKSFSFSLNGTSFNVDDVDKDEPLILDSWCTKGRINYYMGDEFEFSSRFDNETGQMQSYIYVNSTNSYYDQTLFDLYFMLTTTLGEVSKMNTSSYVFVCEMPRIVDRECRRIEIVDSEYVRYPENNSILYSGEVLSMNNYEYVNASSNSLRLCIPKSYTSDSESKRFLVQSCGSNFYNVTLTENYLSFILGIVSLVAMFSVLLTYYLFDSLRNLPGLNTINLTVSLFLAELLFLLSGLTVNQDADWLCKAIAVALHYLFLASFFWTNVMSYDLFRTFGHKCILTKVREKKKFFCRYFVYAWGSPAIIVCACAVIDFSKLVDGLRIGYGSYVKKNSENTDTGTLFSTPSSNWSREHNGTGTIKSSVELGSSFTEVNLGCWIMEPVATLTTFGLPMIIILMVNAIMFIKTIICIRAVAKLAKLKTRRSSLNHAVGKSDVMLYVRMSTVMGFTWLIGLASSIISAFADGPTDTMCIVLHMIGILFILFNCSQGVFIFVAFVFNKRVLGLYKSKIKAWREKDRRKTYFRSTSTLSSSLKY